MLTDFQKQKLPRLFSVHDLNNDGVLNRRDFEEYARRIAQTREWEADSVEATELRARFIEFWEGLEKVGATRGRRDVTLQDWLDYWDRILTTPGMYEQLAVPIGRMVFTMLDGDGDGSVTADEYAAIYKSGGVDPAEANEAFARLDLDHDGRLSVDEIMTLAEQFFRSNNPDDAGNSLFGIVQA